MNNIKNNKTPQSSSKTLNNKVKNPTNITETSNNKEDEIMATNLTRLMDNLDPIIDRKCRTLQKVQKQKKQNIIMLILCFLFLITPSILILLNISIIYFLIPIIIIALINFLIKLPDLLKTNLEAEYHEQLN